VNKTGSGDKVLDWGVIIAALMLFLKTADVLSYFAPTNVNAIIGMDVSILYGGISAALVEGAALALHFNRRAALSATAQIVKWILLGISASCQVFDGYISTGSAAHMSDTLKFGLQFGVPLVPLIVIILLFAVGRLPDDGMEKAPFVGIRNILGPSLNKLWHGKNAPVAYALEKPQEVLESSDKKSRKLANPTKGERA
jgi:hypothetical protein